MASDMCCRWYLVLVFMITASDTAVQVIKKQPHAPFEDLQENLSTESSHKIFSIEELATFNGQNTELPIYVAVKGVVFDVTENKDFYGSGKPYNVFTGKDASRAIAKWSTAHDDINANLDGLSKEEYNRLEETFHNVYMKKYPVVGYLRGYEPRLEEENLTWRKEDL